LSQIKLAPSFSIKATDTVTGVKSKVNLDPWVVSAGFGCKF